MACLLPVIALGGDLPEYLKGYEGRWVGQVSVHSTANGITDTF
ncbi:MAG: hypothetical protein ACPGSB_08345 [Opitutales bacterium]